MKLIVATLLFVEAACATTTAGRMDPKHPAARAEKLGPICADCMEA